MKFHNNDDNNNDDDDDDDDDVCMLSITGDWDNTLITIIPYNFSFSLLYI